MVYQDSCISFGEDDKEALRNLVRKVLRPGCQIVEIGSWLGAGSTRVIIEELKSVEGGRLHCVDTWKGSENVAHHQDVVGHHDVYQTFLQNVRMAGGEPYVQTYVMASCDAVAHFADGSVDLVFIDGDHSYTNASEDISVWMPKVRNGGILCGHDCECRPDRVLYEARRSFPDVDHISGAGTPFEVIHPGVVVAVDQAFDGAAHLWAEAPYALEDGTYIRATLWDVQLPVAVNKRPNQLEAENTLPRLAGPVDGYNVLWFADQYYAVPFAYGPMDFSGIDMSALPPGILMESSYNDILSAITSVNAQRSETDTFGQGDEQRKLSAVSRESVPRLVGSVSDYNIVLFSGVFYAVPQAHGPMDFSQQDLSSLPAGILTAGSYKATLSAILSAEKKK